VIFFIYVIGLTQGFIPRSLFKCNPSGNSILDFFVSNGFEVGPQAFYRMSVNIDSGTRLLTDNPGKQNERTGPLINNSFE
jgi:hypothetical protein